MTLPDAAAIIAKQSCGRGNCPCVASVRRGQGLTHCPSHADPSPSLNVTPSDAAGALVRCHAGCSQDAVVGALKELGVWPESHPRPIPPRPKPAQAVHDEPTQEKRIVAAYDYRDGDNVLFQVVRFEPKGFAQRRPDGKGGWIWGLGDVKPVLYRLPELRIAVKANERIWVVEGEKDADSGATLGLAITSSPMGAGKWRDEYAQEFVGTNVVVVADKDDPHPITGKRPGADHARQVAESLDMAAKTIRILELPGDGVKDLSDWLRSNPPDPALLDEIADATPEWRSPHTARLLTASDRATRYWDILEGRKSGDENIVGWPTGISYLEDVVAYFPSDSWLIVSATAVGKTAMLLTLQKSLDDRGVPSMFATLEQPWEQLMDRQMAAMTEIDSWRIRRGELEEADFQALSEALGRYMVLPSIVIDEPSLTTARLETYLRIAKMKYGTKVVFVDYAQRLRDKDGDSEYLRVSRISNNLARIARELRVCIVSAAQINRRGAQAKDGIPPELDEIRDSGYLEQDASVVLAIGRKEGAVEAKLAVRKNRHGPAGITIDLAFDGKHVRFLELA